MDTTALFAGKRALVFGVANERSIAWGITQALSAGGCTDFVFTYAGVEAPVSEIAPGTLVRISLATWYPGTEPPEQQRCYTQVSGWFTS